jgi:hypothetical protein
MRIKKRTEAIILISLYAFLLATIVTISINNDKHLLKINKKLKIK